MVKVVPRQVKCRNMFEAEGYSRSGAGALVGNFVQEVGQDLPTAFRATTALDHGSQGLAQWRLARLTAYKAFVESQKPELIGKGHVDQSMVDKILWPYYGRLDYQVAFVIHELGTDYPELDKKLRAGGDVAALTADVCWQYERPNKELSGIANRIAYAKAIAADTSTDAKSTTAATPTVVDHLHATADAHTKAQDGGYVAAAGAALGGAALFSSNFLASIPTWELVTLAILLFVVVAGVITARTESKNAANVKAAIPSVAIVPKPVDPEPPEDWAATTSTSAKGVQVLTSTTSTDDIQAKINEAVAKALADQVAKQNQAAVEMTVTKAPGPETMPGASFSIGRKEGE